MKRAFRIAVPFISGMIYIQSGFCNSVITGVQPIDWMVLGALASIPSYIIYISTD